MANDVFGYNSTNFPTIEGGMIFTGKAIMAFNNGQSFKGFMMQNYQLRYMQQITKLRGLNTNGIWVVVAPPTGQLQINSALTGENDFFDFVKSYGNACHITKNSLQIAGLDDAVKVCSGGDAKSLPALTIKGALIGSMALSQQIQDLVLNTGLDLEFTGLEKQ